MNCDLKPVLIFIDEPFDFQEIVLLKSVEDLLNVVPHLGFDLAATVAKGECEIRLAGLLRLDLFGDDDEAGGDDFIFVVRAIG